MKPETPRQEYERRMKDIRAAFEATGNGVACTHSRAALVDAMVLRLWAAEVAADPKLAEGVAVAAVGGYGRAVLFPCSDIDLMFCVERGQDKRAKDPIRRVTQALWDCGLEVAPSTRQPGECDRFDPGNPEFGLALMDWRPLAGDPEVFEALSKKTSGRRWAKEAKAIGAELMALTRERYAKYGNTLFHLEPSIKDCPGGLRDANVCHWLAKLRAGEAWTGVENDELIEGMNFLAAVRCFLHYRHGRDDNTLEWQSQDAAAERRIGLGNAPVAKIDAAYWMRAYFRHARLIERRMMREIEASGLRLDSKPEPKRVKIAAGDGFRVLKGGTIELDPAAGGLDPAHEPEVVLTAFAAIATSGAKLTPESEERIGDAIPHLSALLEEGPGLWRKLSAVLTGRYAGDALRTMHALGVLELIMPEFHGIDALVIRDAYHRYTVDEHTFVLIDTLHGLEDDPPPGAPEWRVKFRSMVSELQNPGLLYLAALLHDTGKGRAGDDHATESARLARGVLDRLEMDAYEASLVMRLIEQHLELSSALRRDIFDTETVRSFASRIQNHELLRMLTLFTYADIQAVHPDALTPWKAETIWRLSMRAANQLDRHVDEERVHAGDGARAWKGSSDKVEAVLALAGPKRAQVEAFLEGFPERYLQTRGAADILRHFEMTQHFDAEPFQLEFHHGGAVSDVTLVTRDRPRLFAGMAAALAAWGMNVVTADAFANAAGVVVDTFRFTDSFRTLELNPAERERFVPGLRELLNGTASVDALLRGRRRGRRKAPRLVVETNIEFDDAASAHSTLMQVIAQDVPGLLRTLSSVLSEFGYNVEVALIDTEGETAIDVFYLTQNGATLNAEQKEQLSAGLRKAIEENAEGGR